MIQAGRIYNLNYHLSIQKSPEDRNLPLLLFTDTAKKQKNYKMNYKNFFADFWDRKMQYFTNSKIPSVQGVQKESGRLGPQRDPLV